MTDLSQHADSTVQHEFAKRLRKWTVASVCGREYVRSSQLERWMSTSLNPDGRTNLEVLHTACMRMRSPVSFPQGWHKIKEPNSKCLTVFSILVELKQGHLIEKFRSNEINDASLPCDRTKLDNVVQREGLPPDLAGEFYSRQWKYQPLMFELGEDRFAGEDRIIPVCRKQVINTKGGTASIHQICVQEEFVLGELREQAKSSLYRDEKFGRCFLFALKTYNADNRDLFENEKNAFRGLEGNLGMIPCFFTFTNEGFASYLSGPLGPIGEGDKHTTYSLLLAYGQYDLQEYFEVHLPPVLEKELLAFWRDLFLVAEAVKGVHTFKRNTQTYFGWHADIKPDNILNILGQFKLADPGFARFEQGSDGSSGKKDATKMWGGTITFGAPECYIGDLPNASRVSLNKVRRSIDIWSLGCVLSVAATWVILGRPGLDQFEQLRKHAITTLVQGTRGIALRKDNPQLGNGDFFHDGKNVLPDVLAWHRYLRCATRANDRITAQILNLVETKMLLSDAEERVSAEDLCHNLRDIMDKAEAQSSPDAEVSRSVTDALLATELAYERAAIEDNFQSSQLQTRLQHLQSQLSRSNSTHLDPAGPNVNGDIKHQLDEIMAALNLPSASSQPSKIVLDPSRSRSTMVVPDARNQYRPTGYMPSMRTVQRSTEVTVDQSYETMLVPEINTTGPAPAPSSETSEGEPSSPPPVSTPGLGPTRVPTRTDQEALGLFHTSPQIGIALTTNRPVTSPRTVTYPTTNRSNTSKSVKPTVTWSRGRAAFGSLISALKKPKTDETLKRYYYNRDIVFLVDNGASMVAHWERVKQRLLDLVVRALGVDKNGMELRFTCSVQESFNSSNKPTDFEKAVKHKSNEPVWSVNTNMGNVLGLMLSDYLHEFRTKRSLTRNRTIICLTDGLWPSMREERSVDEKIIEFGKMLTAEQGNSLQSDNRQLSIQFVQFGNNQDASTRLQRLDDDLEKHGIPDFVDTKPEDADDLEILLGSLDERRDQPAMMIKDSAEQSSSPELMDVPKILTQVSTGLPAVSEETSNSSRPSTKSKTMSSQHVGNPSVRYHHH